MSESIMANWDYLIPADETSLSSNYEPIELFSKSDDFWDYLIFFISILELFSSTFFFFFIKLDYPYLALETEEYPEAESENEAS